MKNNPYQKIYHMLDKIGQNGEASALCFVRPRAIDLKKALWTICEEAVTCKRCRKAIASKAA